MMAKSVAYTYVRTYVSMCNDYRYILCFIQLQIKQIRHERTGKLPVLSSRNGKYIISSSYLRTGYVTYICPMTLFHTKPTHPTDRYPSLPPAYALTARPPPHRRPRLCVLPTQSVSQSAAEAKGDATTGACLPAGAPYHHADISYIITPPMAVPPARGVPPRRPPPVRLTMTMPNK